MYNDSEATYRHGHLPPMSGSVSHIVIVGWNHQSLGLFWKWQQCYWIEYPTIDNKASLNPWEDGTRLTTSLVEVDKGLRISKVEIREAESLGYKIVGDALNGRDRELWLSGEERGRGGVDAEKRVVARWGGGDVEKRVVAGWGGIAKREHTSTSKSRLLCVYTCIQNVLIYLFSNFFK